MICEDHMDLCAITIEIWIFGFESVLDGLILLDLWKLRSMPDMYILYVKFTFSTRQGILRREGSEFSWRVSWMTFARV